MPTVTKTICSTSLYCDTLSWLFPRIKVILRFYKCHAVNIKDRSLVLRLAALFTVTLGFLLVFTLACFFRRDVCYSSSVRWWEVVSWIGKFLDPGEFSTFTSLNLTLE